MQSASNMAMKKERTITPEQIKSLRELMELTQEQLAHELGVDQATVSRIEAGREISRPLNKLLLVILDNYKKRKDAVW